MLISSLDKLSQYSGLQLGVDANGLANRRKLLSWQAALSPIIETHCCRWFEQKTYTEDFLIGPDSGQSPGSLAFFPMSPPGRLSGRTFYPTGLPLSDKPVVKVDPFGLFNGSETTIDAQYVTLSSNGEAFRVFAALFIGHTMRATYPGGLAWHPYRSEFLYTRGTPDPTLVVGDYVTNRDGTAAGIVYSLDTENQIIQVDNLYGIFGAFDEIYSATTEAGLYKTGGDAPTLQLTFVSIRKQSLSESNPALERAAEIETRYMVKHQLDFENVSSMNDQTQRRSPGQMTTGYSLQPETRKALAGYMNFAGLM